MNRREKRRVRVAQRQVLLAQIAQREARYALASALAEEERTATIVARSRALLDEYASRIAHEPAIGQTLRANTAFMRQLGAMVESAGQTQRSAEDLTRRQMAVLATAEARLTGQEARLKDAARSLAAERERRESASMLGSAPGMARKLQSSLETNSAGFAPGLPNTTRPRKQP